jgi:hypothetical protein
MSYPKKTLSNIIENGSHSSTLFHYDTPEKHKNIETRTGWHNDYTAITAVVPGIYMDEDGNIQDYFDREGGLYYKNRLGEVNKIDV